MKSRVALLSLILFINIGTTNAQKADKERLENIVSTLASDEFLGRGFGSEAGARSADLIIEEFKKSGIEPFFEDYRQPFTHRTEVLNIQGNNIVGYIEGSDRLMSAEFVILGAHYDHVGWEEEYGDTIVYNGADDNASGVASIIEIGRILKENQDKLKRSVLLIAFDGEESGLLGSEYFVEQSILGEAGIIDFPNIVAMFSLDMVGMYAKHDGVDLLGMELFAEHEALLEKVTVNYPIKITKVSSDIPDRTDTEPFGELGIPSVHLFTGMESEYHQPEDDTEFLDFEGMAEIVDFTAGLTIELASADEVPRARKMEALSSGKKYFKRFHYGFALNMGNSYYDFKNFYTQTKDVFAYSAGFSLEFRLADWLAFQPEAVYEYRGGHALDGKIRTHAVTTPVSLLLTTSDFNGVRFFYQGGGYYSYAFGGKDPNGALDFVNLYSQTDYGYLIGFGFEIYKLRMAYIWQRSLVDFTPNGDPAVLSGGTATPMDVRGKAYYFKLGWMF